MTKRNTAARELLEPDDEEVLDPPRSTRKVKVNQVTRREFEEDEPVTVDVIEDEHEDWPDPFVAFNEIVSDATNAQLRIWRLPRYDIDGRSSINGTEREYCGSVIYNPNNASMLDQIQGRVPAGGMLMLELFADSKIQKRGLLRISSPQHATQTATSASSSPGIIINPPTAAAPVDPMTIVKQQAESFLAVANVIKQLSPAATVAAVSEPAEPAPLRDRLLEGVILKMVESPKEDSLERVADLLSGGKQSPGWAEAAITAIGPHLGTFLTQVGPGLGAYLYRLASGGAPVAPSVVQSPGSQQAPQQLNGEPVPPAAPVDPGDRAWRRVMGRLLDDLFEHVALVQSGQLGLDVHSSAEAVADLAGRFQEHAQITGIIQQLIAVTPDQVIDLCCLMLPPQAIERLTPMKQSNAALEWLAELQTETRSILNEPAEDAEARDQASEA